MPGKGESNAAANHQRILLHLLNSVDENKYCCDCDAKGPRWASWNLGIFLCIRCAGIHRNLGVHISKVKSVNLDAWTAEQIESVLRMGNKKAREIYEAQLPPGHRRPQEDYALEQFIRNKYDKKMYADTQKLKDSNFEKVDIEKYLAKMGGNRSKPASKPSGGIPAPPSSSASTRPTESTGTKSQKDEKPSSNSASNAAPVQSKPVAPKQNVDELLNFGSPPSAPSTSSQVNSSTSATTAAVNSSTSVAGNATQHTQGAPSFSNSAAPSTSSNSSDLAGLVFDSTQFNDATSLFNQNTAGGDLFGSNFATEEESSKSSATSGGKKTNQDILSLYRTAGPPSLPSTGGPAFSTGANVPSAYQWNQTTNTSHASFPGQPVSQAHGSFSQHQSNFGGGAFNANGNMMAAAPQSADFFNNRHSVLLTQPVSHPPNFPQGGAAPHAFTSQFNQMNLGPTSTFGSASPGSMQGMPSSNPLIQPFNSMSPSQTSNSYNNPFAPLTSQTSTAAAGLHLPPSANPAGMLGNQGQQHGMVNWNTGGGGGGNSTFGSFSGNSGHSGSSSSFGAAAAAGGPSMMNGSNNSAFGMSSVPVAGGMGGGFGAGQFSSANNMFSSPAPFAVQSQQRAVSMMPNMNSSPFSSSSPFEAAAGTGSNSPFNSSTPSSFNPYHSTSQQPQQQSLWLK